MEWMDNSISSLNSRSVKLQSFTKTSDNYGIISVNSDEIFTTNGNKIPTYIIACYAVGGSGTTYLIPGRSGNYLIVSNDLVVKKNTAIDGKIYYIP